MSFISRFVLASSLVLALPSAGLAATPQARASAVSLTAARPSADVQYVVQWVSQSNDNMAMPFVVLDKKGARIFAFAADGMFLGTTPVLLGLAKGDDSVPGIGDRPIGSIKPEERTTPAGRFVTEPGVNTKHEDIVWVSFDDAISMHRARVVDPKERRFERLATPTPSDNRISYGCINIPIGFYNDTIRPLLGSARGVVYVLPETRPVRDMFGPQGTASVRR